MAEITATQNLPLSVEFRDRKGNPATVDSPPEWFVDNSELVSLTPGSDGMTCVASAVGPLGTALVSLRADADMGDGVQEVIGSLEIVITGGPANVVEIVPGTPEEQPV